MTREEALAVATMLVEAYPRDLPATTLKAYAMHLVDLDQAAAVTAVRRLIATSKWLPAIAEVRQEVARLTLPHAKPVEEAWAEAVGLMSKIGSYRGLGTAGSPYVNRTLRLCGRWSDICHEDMSWLRKRFVEIYGNVCASAERSVQTSGALPEWLEAPSDRPQLGNVFAIEDRRRG